MGVEVIAKIIIGIVVFDVIAFFVFLAMNIKARDRKWKENSRQSKVFVPDEHIEVAFDKLR